ncbi:MAG: hypothetical protein LBU28_04460 [Spirochaetaceae bacterium]|nr:hypothetical protein [Spirochaetaceae bacterium]
MLKNPKRFHLRQRAQDDRIDFLCWLYPRISRAIDKYQDTGATFDAYIGSMVFWSSREYRVRERNHHLSEYACWNAGSGDGMVRSPEPDYLDQSPESPPEPVSNPRQILVLLLKAYYFMSDDLVSRIAPAVGLTHDKLTDMISRLRKLRSKREVEIRGLQDRIERQFFRCLSFEWRLSVVPADSFSYQKMLACLERARKRLESMRKRLKAFRFEASNRQVAEVLGVPKGTVDSNLHAAREKYNALIRTLNNKNPEDPDAPGAARGM